MRTGREVHSPWGLGRDAGGVQLGETPTEPLTEGGTGFPQRRVGWKSTLQAQRGV